MLAAALNTSLIRLQCYEGLDVSQAVYEWNYPRQLLEIRHDRSRPRELDRAAATRELFTEAFLIKRPLLRALEETRERASGAAHRRNRSRRRGVRRLSARVPVRFPGDDSGARHDSRRGATGRRHHLEPHARGARRAEAPLRLQLDSVSGLRQGASES